MNKKGSANIALIVLFVILLGAGGYFVFIKNPPETVPQITVPGATTTPIITPPPPPIPIPKKSGIKGVVIGHYCNGAQPAEPPPGYQPCGEGPLASFLLKIQNNIPEPQKEVITDSAGKFQIELPPGKYTITGQTNRAMIGGPFSVDVKSGAFTEVSLNFTELRP